MSGRAADSYTAPENKAALDRLIDRELLREQVRPAQTASPSDVAGRIAEVRKLQPEWGTEEGWHAALERYGLTQAAIEKRLSNEIQLMKLVERSPSAFDSDRSKSSRKLLSEPASPGGKEDGGECQALAGNVREDSDVTRGKENERTALRMAGQFTLRQPHSHARIQCGRRKPLSDPPSLPVRRRILRKLLLAFCLLSATVFALLAWYVTTDSFQQKMRRRVVAELERATGGRVELGELHTIPFRLRVDVRNLTVHGKEALGQRPFVQVERVEAEMKIVSLLGNKRWPSFRAPALDHPVINVIDYPDGTTNVPAPLLNYSPDPWFEHGPVERLISLSVSRIEVQHGELSWKDGEIPFNFDARNLAPPPTSPRLRQRYEAHVAAADIDTHWQQYPGFVWSADASACWPAGAPTSAALRSNPAKPTFTSLHNSRRTFTIPQSAANTTAWPTSGNSHRSSDCQKCVKGRCRIGQRQGNLEPTRFLNRWSDAGERCGLVERNSGHAQRARRGCVLTDSSAAAALRY